MQNKQKLYTAYVGSYGTPTCRPSEIGGEELNLEFSVTVNERCQVKAVFVSLRLCFWKQSLGIEFCAQGSLPRFNVQATGSSQAE